MKSLRYRLLVLTVFLLLLAGAFLIINNPSNAVHLAVVFTFLIAIVFYMGKNADVLPTSLRTNFLILFRNPVLLNATIYFRYGKMVHYNWGDDMNYFFINELLNLPTAIFGYSYLRKKKGIARKENFLVIGSTITMLTTPDTVVWGAGVVDEKEPLPALPKEVLAVRGPLTRKYLLSKGVECPEIYGDPILLLKYFYKPDIEKKYKIGVIPHYADFDDEKFDALKNDSRVLFINMKGYADWKDIVNQVLSCEFIISSSLHGLIISETYSIPNLWIKVSDRIRGGEFKYQDYYQSIGIMNALPFCLQSDITFEELWKKKGEYIQGSIELQALINSAPIQFSLSKQIKSIN